MTEDQFRKGPEPEEFDVLSITVPEGIPGALFQALMRKLLETYKPGTIINTAAGAGKKAEIAALACLETMISYYEAVAAEEG